MKRANCVHLTVSVKSRRVVASHRVRVARKSTAIWPAPNAVPVARDVASRQARSCLRFAAGSPAKAVTAALQLDRVGCVAVLALRPAIAAPRVASRVPVVKAVGRPALTAASVAASPVPPLALAIAPAPAEAGHKHRDKAKAKARVIAATAIRPVRKVRVVIVLKAQADRKVKAAIALRVVADVPRVTVVDVRRAAAVAVAAAINRVTAELRLGGSCQSY